MVRMRCGEEIFTLGPATNLASSSACFLGSTLAWCWWNCDESIIVADGDEEEASGVKTTTSFLLPW